MQDIDDSTVSGRILTNHTNVYHSSDKFSDMEEIPSVGYNRIVNAVRYGKHFVLKGLKQQYRDEDIFQTMLRKEFEIMILMEHPNIVRVYTMEEIEEVGLCIVMEYVDGMPLDKWLEVRKPSMAQRKRIVLQLLDAMRHWHSHQVVHRDLKPSNILVTRNGDNVKVIDFGLADADQYAVLKEPAYTLRYASPEQLHGGPLDCRSDIYSFGRLMHLILPHRHSTIAARCCRHSREQRYPSAEAVMAALRRRRVLVIPMILLPILVLLSLFFMTFRYTSKPFEYKVTDGQILKMQIVSSKAVVTGYDTVSGALVLPERVRHRLLRYPLYEIADRAFYQCRTMEHIVFPSTLRRIGDEAFSGCTALNDTLVLTEGLEYLGDGVFNNCERISVCRVKSRRLHLKPNPDKNGRFGNTIGMHTIIIDNTIDTLCEQLFHWAYWGVKDIYLAEGLTHLGNASLSELYNLERIHFPSTLRQIDAGCFFGCGIRRLVIPDNVEAIDDYALAVLYKCHYLEFGAGVKSLGSNVVYAYRELDTLVFRSPVPPTTTATSITLDTQYPAPTVLVPAKSLELYLADSTFRKLNPVGF